MNSELIIAEARTWIGTPYRHQHSTKGRGCDCLGLVRGVYREVYGSEPEKPPNYSPMWGEVGDDEPLLSAAARHLTPVSDWLPGDVLVFRMKHGMVAKHCGIVSSHSHMIHAYQGARSVTESPLGSSWVRRVAGAFRFP